MEKTMGFAAACKDYFGFQEGQTLAEFMQEVRALTPEDKAEISKGLEHQGYKIKS